MPFLKVLFIIKNLKIKKYFVKHEIVIVTFLFNDTKIYFLNIFYYI